MNDTARRECLRILLLLLAVLTTGQSVAAEIVISSLDAGGRVQQVPRAKLVDDEIVALDLFEQKNPPTEIYLLAEGRPYMLHMPELGNEYHTTMVLRYPDRWELRWYTAASRKFYHERRLTNVEAQPVTELVTKSAVHRMTPVKETRGKMIVGGVEYAFTHLTPQGGSRVLINNPGSDRGIPADDLRKYQACVAAFRTLVESKQPWQVSYTYHRRLQVEHLFADPRQPVKRVLVKDDKAYVFIGKTAAPFAPPDQWFVLENGKLQQTSDPLAAAPKKSPDISHTRLSADGKWLAGNLKSDGTLICRNRVEEKGVAIPDEVVRLHGTPLYFLDSHQAFVIGVVQTPVVPDRENPPYFELFALSPAKAELVKLGKLSATLAFDPKVWQQLMPEKLQAVAKSPDEVWLSAPAGRATQFGKYNTKTLEWVHAQHIPDAQFSPRDFFVDEQAGKLYFREDEQLLRFSLPAEMFEKQP